MRVNINADIGESYGKYRIGDDQRLMAAIASANIACGMHAGDPTIMAETVRLALANGVTIGAHPGFNDILGFGRRQIRMEVRDLEYLVAYQIGALQGIARGAGGKVTHVKPHGALNNMAHDDIDYARAIACAIKSVDPELIFVANAGSAMSKAGREAGLRVAEEAYADRRYDENGKMLSRQLGNALIRDAQEAAEHVLRMCEERAIVTVGGNRIPSEIHTFCIHGDEPTAVAVATAVRERLEKAGIAVVPLPELIGAK